MRELELVLEVGEGAQAADDDARLLADAEIDEQPLEDLELEAGRIPGGPTDELDPLLGREQRVLADVR